MLLLQTQRSDTYHLTLDVISMIFGIVGPSMDLTINRSYNTNR